MDISLPILEVAGKDVKDREWIQRDRFPSATSTSTERVEARFTSSASRPDPISSLESN